MSPSNIDVTKVKKHVIRTMNHLSDKVWIVTALGVIMSLFLIACTSTTPITPKPEILTQSDTVVQETTDLPEPVITSTKEELPSAVTAEELKRLREEIDAKIQQAIEEADPVRKILFEMSKRVGLVADLFANNLTSPENPADRILDPDSFSIGLTPDGIAYLKLEVDSIWGKAGEVAIIDKGDDKGMFVSLTGAGIQNCTLAFDEKGYYSVARDEAGKIVAAVDSSRQWTINLAESQMLPDVDVSQQMAEAYLNGEIIYPTGLTEEQEVAFENALAEVEPDLSEKQRRQIIVHRFQRESEIFEGFERKINAFDALVNKDGNLEYYDGSWHTIEKMVSPGGIVLPWGEMFYTRNEDSYDELLKILGDDKDTVDGIQNIIDIHQSMVENYGNGDPNEAGVLFVQAVPPIAKDWKTIILGKKLGYYETNFFLILKENQKLKVVKTVFCISGSIYVLHIEESKRNVLTNLYDIKTTENMYFKNGLIGLPSEVVLTTLYPKTITPDYNEREKKYVENGLEASAEQFLTNPVENAQKLTLTFSNYIQIRK